MSCRQILTACALLIELTAACQADIFRWDTGEVIPGTKGIVPRPGVLLHYRNLEFADLRGQDLANAYLAYSTLANADLTGANLTGSSLDFATLANANLTGANLTYADVYHVTLTNANLSRAFITGARFFKTGSPYLTKEQLYSTSSYQAKDLRETSFGGLCTTYGCDLNDLTNWDFSGQNLANADFTVADLSNANLTGTNLSNAIFRVADLANANLIGADSRGAVELNLAQVESRNAILPSGSIVGLNLAANEGILVRDEDGVSDPAAQWWLQPRPPIPVRIHDGLTMDDGSVLQLRFDADPWDSLISFESGISVQLGGALELSFADDVNLATQVGRPLRIFDWTGVSPSGQFKIQSPYVWDLTNLYTTGEVTLIAVPETSAASILLVGVLAFSARRRLIGFGLRR